MSKRRQLPADLRRSRQDRRHGACSRDGLGGGRSPAKPGLKNRQSLRVRYYRWRYPRPVLRKAPAAAARSFAIPWLRHPRHGLRPNRRANCESSQLRQAHAPDAPPIAGKTRPARGRIDALYGRPPEPCAQTVAMSGASSAFMPTTLYPASTWWISPVTPDARSEHRYSPAPPTSSIVTFRRNGELYSFHFMM